jgi:hypothetical protein
MANRLSHETRVSIYQQGCKAFSLGSEVRVEMLPNVDFGQILAQGNAGELIKSIAPQVLYFSLKKRGLSDCLEIIPHLSSEQFLRIFDYDVWTKDELNHKKLALWLSLCAQVSPEHLVSRFKSLDEEYQMSFLASLVLAYDSTQFESLEQIHQDRLYCVAGNQLYYDVLSDDKLVHETIVTLIEALLVKDLSFAISLLALVTYSPPHESETLLQQFRRARLEEDGFITYEEGESYFSCLDAGKDYAKFTVSSKDGLVATNDQSLLFDQALAVTSDSENLKLSLLRLVNAMCSVTSLELDDTVGLRHLMAQVRGLVNLGLEGCSGSVAEACVALDDVHLKNIFKAGLLQVNSLRKIIVASFAEQNFLQLGKLEKYIATGRFGLALDLLDKNLSDFLGLQRLEVIKGAFNRFPMAPVIEQAEQVEKIFFKPLEKKSELESLTLQISSYLSLIKLLSSLSSNLLSKSVDMDTQFLQQIACFVVGNDSSSLLPEDITALQNKSEEFIEKRSKEFALKYLGRETELVKKEIYFYFEQLFILKKSASLGDLL